MSNPFDEFDKASSVDPFAAVDNASADPFAAADKAQHWASTPPTGLVARGRYLGYSGLTPEEQKQVDSQFASSQAAKTMSLDDMRSAMDAYANPNRENPSQVLLTPVPEGSVLDNLGAASSVSTGEVIPGRKSDLDHLFPRLDPIQKAYGGIRNAMSYVGALPSAALATVSGEDGSYISVPDPTSPTGERSVLAPGESGTPSFARNYSKTRSEINTGDADILASTLSDPIQAALLGYGIVGKGAMGLAKLAGQSDRALGAVEALRASTPALRAAMAYRPDNPYAKLAYSGAKNAGLGAGLSLAASRVDPLLVEESPADMALTGAVLGGATGAAGTFLRNKAEIPGTSEFFTNKFVTDADKALLRANMDELLGAGWLPKSRRGMMEQADKMAAGTQPYYNKAMEAIPEGTTFNAYEITHAARKKAADRLQAQGLAADPTADTPRELIEGYISGEGPLRGQQIPWTYSVPWQYDVPKASMSELDRIMSGIQHHMGDSRKEAIEKLLTGRGGLDVMTGPTGAPLKPHEAAIFAQQLEAHTLKPSDAQKMRSIATQPETYRNLQGAEGISRQEIQKAVRDEINQRFEAIPEYEKAFQTPSGRNAREEYRLAKTYMDMLLHPGQFDSPGFSRLEIPLPFVGRLHQNVDPWLRNSMYYKGGKALAALGLQPMLANPEIRGSLSRKKKKE